MARSLRSGGVLDRQNQRRAETHLLQEAPGQARGASGEAHPEVDRLAKFVLAALHGGPTQDVPRKRIAPGTTLPLELTDRERDLILKHSFAEEDLTRMLRVVPPPGQPAVVRCTFGELDDLAGYVASESNHSKDRRLQREWQAICAKIEALLESYTDGQG